MRVTSPSPSPSRAIRVADALWYSGVIPDEKDQASRAWAGDVALGYEREAETSSLQAEPRGNRSSSGNLAGSRLVRKEDPSGNEVDLIVAVAILHC